MVTTAIHLARGCHRRSARLELVEPDHVRAWLPIRRAQPSAQLPGPLARSRQWRLADLADPLPLLRLRGLGWDRSLPRPARTGGPGRRRSPPGGPGDGVRGRAVAEAAM